MGGNFEAANILDREKDHIYRLAALLKVQDFVRVHQCLPCGDSVTRVNSRTPSSCGQTSLDISFFRASGGLAELTTYSHFALCRHICLCRVSSPQLCHCAHVFSVMARYIASTQIRTGYATEAREGGRNILSCHIPLIHDLYTTTQLEFNGCHVDCERVDNTTSPAYRLFR